MIIDQLPEISTVQETDEIPVERGTTTYKTTLQKLKDLVAPIITLDSAAITTSHTIKAVRVARIGRIYIANITVQVTSNLSAWTTIFTLNNVTLPESQYVYGDVNGGTATTFYIGRAGDVSCTTALQNNSTIKIATPLVIN